MFVFPPLSSTDSLQMLTQLKIVHNDFPLPAPPLPTPVVPSNFDPEVVALTPPTLTETETQEQEQEQDILETSNDDVPPNSQNSTKENDIPTDPTPTRPPVPGFSSPRPHFPVQPAGNGEDMIDTLPSDLRSLYNSSTQILSHDFAQSPPYTLQRLAEMVLYPKRHYRFLPAYLRALDRIVSVSSPVSDFPLPTLNASLNGAHGFLTNGDSGAQNNGLAERDALGSDESLGGALLTPIPWLRNTSNGNGTAASSNSSSRDGELHSESTETIEGPNGAGSIETVSVTVNGVPSTTSASHTFPNTTGSGPPNSSSPTLSEQSDASSSGSTSPEATPSTEAQLRQQGGVTQGELLRQEQEAGVVPVAQNTPHRTLMAGGAIAAGREPATITPQQPITFAGAGATVTVSSPEATDAMDEDEKAAESDERPHARGPEEIGMEDIGTQPVDAVVPSTNASGERNLDMEAAVGRAKSPIPPPAVTSPPPDAPDAVEAEDAAPSTEQPGQEE